MKVVYTDLYSPNAEELETYYLRAPGDLKAPLSLPAITHEEPMFLSIRLSPPQPRKRIETAAIVKPGKSSLF